MAAQNENNQVNNSNNDEFFGFALAIVLIGLGAFLFFGWEQLGNEFFLKIVAMILLLLGFSGFGMEITKRTNVAAATDLGIGLGLIVTGFVLGEIDFAPKLLSLFIVGFGAIPVLSSVFNIFFKARNPETPDLSFLYKSLIITGQVAGSLMAIIEFVQFFMN